MAQLKSTLVTGNLSVTDDIVASKFIKNGGTNAQLLRADGGAAALTATEVTSSLGYTPSGVIAFTGGTNKFSYTINGANSKDVTITPSVTISVGSNAAWDSTTPFIGAIASGTNGITVTRKSLADIGLSTVFRYKGVKAKYTELPTTGNTTGDVWNVTDKGGMNYAWNGSAWQPIGGTLDLSGYALGAASSTTNASALFSNTGGKQLANSGKTIVTTIGSDDSTLPTSKAIKTYITGLNYITSASVGTGVLTIQKNGTAVATFSANASSAAIANITVPTKVSELTNDSGYITSYTDTNTWREIKVDGTLQISSTSSTALNLKAGSNVSLSYSSGTVTITGTGDTKNTAGSTNSNSKLYLIGATSQAANPQTYSDSEVYTTNGTLTTAKTQIGGGEVTLEYDSTKKALKFVF